MNELRSFNLGKDLCVRKTEDIFKEGTTFSTQKLVFVDFLFLLNVHGVVRDSVGELHSSYLSTFVFSKDTAILVDILPLS